MTIIATINSTFFFTFSFVFLQFFYSFADKQKIENETKKQMQRDSTIEVLEEQLKLWTAKVNIYTILWIEVCNLDECLFLFLLLCMILRFSVVT